MLLPYWLLLGISFASAAFGAAVDLEARENGGNHLMARAFSLTVSGSSYIVDTNAGLIFTVDNTNCGTSRSILLLLTMTDHPCKTLLR